MNHARLLWMMTFLAGCSGKVVGGQCAETSQCPGGNVCLQGECLAVCTLSADCRHDEHCGAGVCLPGAPGSSGLRIENVEGNGIDGAHVRDRLLVTGEGLSGAAVGLIGDSASWSLTVLEGTDASLVAMLPSDVVAGSYVLNASNGGGGDEQAINLLADPSTPDELLSMLLTVDGTGTGLDADTLDGVEASAFATTASLAPIEAALATAEDDLARVATFSPASSDGIWEQLDLTRGILSHASVQPSPIPMVVFEANQAGDIYLTLVPPPAAAGTEVLLEEVILELGGPVANSGAPGIYLAVRSLNKVDGVSVGTPGDTVTELYGSYTPPQAVMDKYFVRSVKTDFDLSTGALPLPLDVTRVHSLDIYWDASSWVGLGYLHGIRVKWRFVP